MVQEHDEGIEEILELLLYKWYLGHMSFINILVLNPQYLVHLLSVVNHI